MASDKDAVLAVLSSIRSMLGYLCVKSDKELTLGAKVAILDRFELSDADRAQICRAKTSAIQDARKINKKKEK